MRLTRRESISPCCPAATMDTPGSAAQRTLSRGHGGCGALACGDPRQRLVLSPMTTTTRILSPHRAERGQASPEPSPEHQGPPPARAEGSECPLKPNSLNTRAPFNACLVSSCRTPACAPQRSGDLSAKRSAPCARGSAQDPQAWGSPSGARMEARAAIRRSGHRGTRRAATASRLAPGHRCWRESGAVHALRPCTVPVSGHHCVRATSECEGTHGAALPRRRSSRGRTVRAG